MVFAGGVEATDFGFPFVEAESDGDVIAHVGKSLEEKRNGIDEGAKELRVNAASDGVFGQAGEESVDVGGGAEFASGAEEIFGKRGVRALLLEEAAFAVRMEDAEIVVCLRTRHAAGAAVGERELAEIAVRF